MLLIHIFGLSPPLIVTLLLVAAKEILEALSHYPVVRWCQHLWRLVGSILIEVSQDKTA
jgi:hypothetical protein